MNEISPFLNPCWLFLMGAMPMLLIALGIPSFAAPASARPANNQVDLAAKQTVPNGKLMHHISTYTNMKGTVQADEDIDDIRGNQGAMRAFEADLQEEIKKLLTQKHALEASVLALATLKDRDPLEVDKIVLQVANELLNLDSQAKADFTGPHFLSETMARQKIAPESDFHVTADRMPWMDDQTTIKQNAGGDGGGGAGSPPQMQINCESQGRASYIFLCPANPSAPAQYSGVINC